MCNFKFPEGFLWGVAGSAFQMEGGMYEDGKDMNIREAAWLDSVRRGGVQLQDEVERPAPDLQERYHGLEMIVTENGYTQRREDVFNMDLTPFHQDTARQEYIREHVRSCSRAIRAGANLTGYFYWSAMDLWESSMGYGYPMGLVAVNFDTLERFPRESFYYYQKIVQSNMVD